MLSEAVQLQAAAPIFHVSEMLIRGENWNQEIVLSPAVFSLEVATLQRRMIGFLFQVCKGIHKEQAPFGHQP